MITNSTTLTSPQGQQIADIWAVFNDLPVPAAAYDTRGEGRLQVLNAAFQDSFGYSLSDIPNVATWVEVAYPDPHYREMVLAQWEKQIVQRQATGRQAPPSEYRLRDKSGHTRDVMIGFALHGPFVLVTFQDVTDLRAAQAALDAERRQAEQTAFALTENMPGGAYTMVLKPGEGMARFTFLSERFLEMLDLDRAEVQADPMAGFACVHPEDRDQWVAWNAEAFARREPFSRETRILVRGETRWIRAESVPRMLEDGSVIWEGILVDITQLKATEARLTEVLRAARAFTWRRELRNQKPEADLVSAAVAGDVAAGSDELSSDFWQSVHPDDLEETRDRIIALESGVTQRDVFTYRQRTEKDSWVWLQVHAVVSACDAAGRPTALSGISFDISQEMNTRLMAQETEAQLREDLQRAHQRDTVAQVAGGIAHDLNNHLSLITWTLERLSPHGKNSADILEGLQQIRRAVDLASDLTVGLDGLMHPDRPGSQQDLSHLLQSALNMLGTQRVARHDVKVDVPNGVLPIWGHPTEILQVITNLVVNACDAGTEERPSKVRIKVQPMGTQLPDTAPETGALQSGGHPFTLFEISDTGLGIADEIRSRVFHRNFTTKGSQGTGLGLPIVARILQRNGAALWLETGLERGTTVTVGWPSQSGRVDLGASTGFQDRLQASDRAIEADALKGLQVLVVDDILDVAEVIASMLEAAGADVFTVTDPELAVEALSDPDAAWSVLVTDLHMPGPDGQALARLAASLSPPLPSVLVTARPDAIGRDTRTEFAAILAKPVSGAQLVQVVSDVVQK